MGEVFRPLCLARDAKKCEEDEKKIEEDEEVLVFDGLYPVFCPFTLHTLIQERVTR